MEVSVVVDFFLVLCQSNQVRSREIDDDMDGKPDKLAFSAQVRVKCVYMCACMP